MRASAAGCRSTAGASTPPPATARWSASIPANGTVLWTQKVGEPVRSSPTAAGGKVFFVSTDSVLHCLDGADGQEQWTARGVPEPATLLSNVSPAVGNGLVVAAFPAGDIVAYKIGNGDGAWRESLSRYQ